MPGSYRKATFCRSGGHHRQGRQRQQDLCGWARGRVYNARVAGVALSQPGRRRDYVRNFKHKQSLAGAVLLYATMWHVSTDRSPPAAAAATVAA